MEVSSSVVGCRLVVRNTRDQDSEPKNLELGDQFRIRGHRFCRCLERETKMFGL